MQRKKRGLRLSVLLVLIGIGAVAGYFYVHKSTKDIAKEAIDTFYEYEQDGAFSDSWAMFHPQMKDKFTKVDYLQDRPAMLLNEIGVDTFTYTLGEPKRIQNWTMETGAEPIDVVYKSTVTLAFQGKYGNLEWKQDVYTTELDGGWMILWDYRDR